MQSAAVLMLIVVLTDFKIKLILLRLSPMPVFTDPLSVSQDMSPPYQSPPLLNPLPTIPTDGKLLTVMVDILPGLEMLIDSVMTIMSLR